MEKKDNKNIENLEITNIINENEINIYSFGGTNSKRRAKKSNSNYKIYRFKNFDISFNNSSSKINLSKNNINSLSQFNIYDEKKKEFNKMESSDEIDYEEKEDVDNYLSDEEKF